MDEARPSWFSRLLRRSSKALRAEPTGQSRPEAERFRGSRVVMVPSSDLWRPARAARSMDVPVLAAATLSARSSSTTPRLATVSTSPARSAAPCTWLPMTGSQLRSFKLLEPSMISFDREAEEAAATSSARTFPRPWRLSSWFWWASMRSMAALAELSED